MKKRWPAMMVFISALPSCGGDDAKDSADLGSGSTLTASPEPGLLFEDLKFTKTNAYFSTDGSMSAPVAADQARAVANIDITFFFDGNYTQPGFLDPVARSKDWYWDDYVEPWLADAVETKFYYGKLTSAQFDNAKSNSHLIAGYFETSSLVLTPHAIFPAGSSVGGRETDNPSSIELRKGQVFAFEHTSTGARGLLRIRADQASAWPVPFLDTTTKVDIVREQ